MYRYLIEENLDQILFLTLFHFIKTHLIIDYKLIIYYGLNLIAYHQVNY